MRIFYRSHVKDREVLRKAELGKSGVNGLARKKEASDFERRVLTSPVLVSGEENVGELLTVTERTEEEILADLSMTSEAIPTANEWNRRSPRHRCAAFHFKLQQKKIKSNGRI
ncbi:PREDICTED: uncharacterized protein LOC108358890 [Rhagoletis zephyria]|uniref:uncharacterized protein LOC108358890 n=1 Tax=Rhagoletis zephyria TaxID=28612 RepID=UPI000811545E|nr:PREDICTED: uncharacterized protein LOC108358890 [Rhagoletis zephyria]XP_036335178.1 uncharacterized protein LOC118745692 [Rhagoletis pomonella]